MTSAGNIVRKENPLSLNLNFDRSGTGFRLDYRIRWDSDSLRRLPQNLGAGFRAPSRLFQGTGINLIRGTSVGVYGAHVRPTRLWDARGNGGSDSSPHATATEEEASSASVDPIQARRRLTLAPVVEDIKQGLRNEVRRTIITTTFDYTIPQYRNRSFYEKDAVFQGINQSRKVWGWHPD